MSEEEVKKQKKSRKTEPHAMADDPEDVRKIIEQYIAEEISKLEDSIEKKTAKLESMRELDYAGKRKKFLGKFKSWLARPNGMLFKLKGTGDEIRLLGRAGVPESFMSQKIDAYANLRAKLVQSIAVANAYEAFPTLVDEVGGPFYTEGPPPPLEDETGSLQILSTDGIKKLQQ